MESMNEQAKFSMQEMIRGCIKDFAENGVVFSNEAQFQFALAWKLGEKLALEKKEFEIILEHLVMVGDKKYYIDILIRIGNDLYPIELKYKSAAKNLTYKSNGREYHTFNQGAEDCGSYDFLKDIMRLELLTDKNLRVLSDYTVQTGFAIMMTNDYLYKRAPLTKTNGDHYCWEQFFLTPNKTIKGTLNWVDKNGNTINKPGEAYEKIRKTYGEDRAKPITLTKKEGYLLEWQPYSNGIRAENEKRNDYQFSYLIIEIDHIDSSD